MPIQRSRIANLHYFAKVAHSLPACSDMHRASFFPTRPGEVALSWGRMSHSQTAVASERKNSQVTGIENKGRKNSARAFLTSIHRRVLRTKVREKLNSLETRVPKKRALSRRQRSGSDET
jgi:hypothetical protein